MLVPFKIAEKSHEIWFTTILRLHIEYYYEVTSYNLKIIDHSNFKF